MSLYLFGVLDRLEAGYTVRLHGKKITKTETRKEMRK